MGDPFIPPDGHSNTKATTDQKRTLLKRLREHLGKSESNLLFLRNSKQVIKAVKELYPESANSQQNRIGALCAITKSLVQQGYPTYANAVRAYCKENEKMRKELTALADSRVPTEKQMADFVPWDTIVSEFNKLKSSVGSSDWRQYQKAVVLGLYVLLPPVRVDYAPMLVVKSVKDNPKLNTLLLTPSKAQFFIPVYKTAKSHGINIYDAPDELADMLRTFTNIKAKEGAATDVLLLNSYGKPMTKYNLGHYIRELMESVTGKRFGVQMLRHSYNSKHISTSDDLNTVKGRAKIMGHGLGTALQYAKRFTEPE
jgi:hypothetical protein